MTQLSALSLSGVMGRLRSIVAKAKSTGSVRNITGEVAKTGTTGAVALGGTNIAGVIAAGSSQSSGSIAKAALTGDVAYQE
jgi:hypothetical protein